MIQKFALKLLQPVLLAAATLSALGSVAEAHSDHNSAFGFDAGFLHPLSGIDHTLVMVAVGVVAARLGGKLLWALPATFMGMMVAGAALGMNGLALPLVEFAIATSLIFLGAAIALDFNVSVATLVVLVGFFGIFHGHAHGSEVPLAASGLHYGLGFTVATALLHMLGLILGLGFGKVSRAVGASVVAAGLGLMAGYIQIISLGR